MLLRSRMHHAKYSVKRLSRSYATVPLTIGIRREDPERIWERRCPLTPDAVHELVKKENIQVLIQDCDRRVFPMVEFVKAGAQVHSTLEPAHITVGIKETPVPELHTTPINSIRKPGQDSARTHLMFSHTIKGQAYNMPLLSRFLEGSSSFSGQAIETLPRLVDYELLCGPDGKRTVGFGWFAGVAGAIESLSAMAHAHLELGVASPFLYTPRPHTHPSLESLKKALSSVGDMIATHGTPPSLGPLIIGVTGNGQVAKGVLEILQQLPTVHVTVDDLPRLTSDPDVDLCKIYVVHALPHTYLVGLAGRAYERSDYYANPAQYESHFSSKIAPYLSLFINCTGWAPSFPRVMSNEQLAIALEAARAVGLGRMASIGDISCDIEGGLEFLERSSTLSSPFYNTRPASLPSHLPDVQMMAVDILPSSIPYDASVHFSTVLMPYLRVLAQDYRGGMSKSVEDNDLRRSLEDATVAQRGHLAPRHEWLQDRVGAWRQSVQQSPNGVQGASSLTDSMKTASPSNAAAESTSSAGFQRKKRVLLLGSGMVAGPTVEEISKREDIELVIASIALPEAEALARGKVNVTAVLMDMAKLDATGAMIAQADVVISLLPVAFHPSVADLCIKHRKHLVTASYISPAMRALHERAQDAGVILLNEIGLDPGIDHCSAIKLISDLRAQGKEIVSFISFCGGLPAPEHADHIPLGYKFSWSPKGVLLATLNEARFRLANKDVVIPEKDLLTSRFTSVPISNVLNFEGIANRDSYPYGPTYGLSKDIRTLLRGTLRYPGYCDLVQSFKDIGLLDTNILKNPISSWANLVPSVMRARGIAINDDDRASVNDAAQDVLGSARAERLFDALTWLGLDPSSSSSDLPKVSHDRLAPIDYLTSALAHGLRYQPLERDVVVLSHEVIARPASSGPKAAEEIHTSQLITYGTPSASAMSRTVGLPVAFAALQVLDGKVSVRGVQGPTHREVYDGVLMQLENAGLRMHESVRKGASLEAQLSKQLH